MDPKHVYKSQDENKWGEGQTGGKKNCNSSLVLTLLKTMGKCDVSNIKAQLIMLDSIYTHLCTSET